MVRGENDSGNEQKGGVNNDITLTIEWWIEDFIINIAIKPTWVDIKEAVKYFDIIVGTIGAGYV